MRVIGLILSAIGFGILAFIIFFYFTNHQEKLISPLPGNQGTGIIVVTPTKIPR